MDEGWLGSLLNAALEFDTVLAIAKKSMTFHVVVDAAAQHLPQVEKQKAFTRPARTSSSAAANLRGPTQSAGLMVGKEDLLNFFMEDWQSQSWPRTFGSR